MAIPWGTIASVGSTLLGALSGNKAQKKQNALLEQQMAQQTALSNRQMDLAERMNQQGLATQIDANGNITYYDPATNTWRSILAPKQQELQDLSDAELKQALQIDVPLSRAEGLTGALRRAREGNAAQGAFRDVRDLLQGTGAYRASDLASSLRLSRENAVNQGFDSISNAALTQALRSGSGGGGAILGALAKQRGQAIAQTIGNPEVEAYQLADSLNADKMNSKLSTYNLLASRASGAPSVDFQPLGIGQSLTQSLANARSAGMQGAAGAGQLTANASSILSNMKLPDYTKGGDASLFGAISNLLGSGALTDLFGNRNKTKNDTKIPVDA